jgi:hypothetical protein
VTNNSRLFFLFHFKITQPDESPRTYKSMEDPDFMKFKFKRLYTDPVADVADDKYKKLMKDIAFETAKCYLVDE